MQSPLAQLWLMDRFRLAYLRFCLNDLSKSDVGNWRGSSQRLHSAEGPVCKALFKFDSPQRFRKTGWLAKALR